MRKTDATAGERRFLLYNYLIRNTGEGRVKTPLQIFDYLLLEHGIEKPNIKTFYADLAALEREAYGLQIQYDKKLHGYWVMNPPFTRDDLRWMVDSIQASKFLTQKKADEITRKIRELACEEDKRSLHRPAFVADRVRNMNESIVEESSTIYQAINANRKISFRYFHRTPDRKTPMKYSKGGKRVVVSPFALLWDNGNYYMYAYDAADAKFRTYRVDRMDDVRIDEIERDGVEAYNKKLITDRQFVVFDMYHGDAYRVELRCHNTITDAVIDRFGNRILLSPTDEDHFKTTVPVELSPPFYAWVATFGHKIKICHPQEAVDGMKKFLQKACDMYEQNGEK